MFSIGQFNHCPASAAPSSACLLTSIMVQIPFDISVPSPLVASLINNQPGTIATSLKAAIPAAEVPEALGAYNIRRSRGTIVRKFASAWSGEPIRCEHAEVL